MVIQRNKPATMPAPAQREVGAMQISAERQRYRCTHVDCGHKWAGKRTVSGLPTRFCPECKRKTAEVVIP
jgi:hypothetical protein